MANMKKIYKKQLQFVKAIADDVIKHNASNEVIEHANGYAHLENSYGEYWRINWGEAYCYIPIDEDGNVNGRPWWNNDEMRIDSSSYTGSLKELAAMSADEANDTEFAESYDDVDANTYSLEYVPM